MKISIFAFLILIAKEGSLETLPNSSLIQRQIPEICIDLFDLDPFALRCPGDEKCICIDIYCSRFTMDQIEQFTIDCATLPESGNPPNECLCAETKSTTPIPIVVPITRRPRTEVERFFDRIYRSIDALSRIFTLEYLIKSQVGLLQWFIVNFLT